MFKKLQARYAENQRKNAIAIIRERFRIEETSGGLILTHDGTAIHTFPLSATIHEVITRLEKARDAAVAQRFPEEAEHDLWHQGFDSSQPPVISPVP